MAVDAQIKAKRLEMINMESYIMCGQSNTNGERKRVPQVGCSMGEVLQMGVMRVRGHCPTNCSMLTLHKLGDHRKGRTFMSNKIPN